MKGLNPKMMQQAMKKMGMQQQEINASEVIIKTNDKTLVISNPEVVKVNMMGQESFQITGEVSEQSYKPDISEDDINTVIEQATVSKEEAAAALEETNGDIAEAILKLQN